MRKTYMTCSHIIIMEKWDEKEVIGMMTEKILKLKMLENKITDRGPPII